MAVGMWTTAPRPVVHIPIAREQPKVSNCSLNSDTSCLTILDTFRAAVTALLVPVIRVPFLRHFRRVYSFSTALILTNWQVLAVVEQGTGSSAGKYGEAWLFCSLGHIVSATLEDVPAYQLRALRLDLRAGPCQDVVNIPYPPKQEDDFQSFVHAIYQTKGDVP